VQILAVEPPCRKIHLAATGAVMPGGTVGRAPLRPGVAVRMLADDEQWSGQLDHPAAQRKLREERPIGAVKAAVQQRVAQRLPADEPEEIHAGMRPQHHPRKARRWTERIGARELAVVQTKVRAAG